MSTLSGLDNSKKYTAKIKLLNGKIIKVHSTADSPDSSYGIQCWVDYKGRSYGQITYNHPTQQVFDVQEIVSFRDALTDAGLSISDFSYATGTPERTAMSWISCERRTPQIAFAWVDLYKKLKLSGA